MLSIEQIEKMTDEYLDELIKNLNKEEKEEEKYLQRIIENKNFIFNNLDNNEINFDFDFSFENIQDFNFCYIYVSFKDKKINLKNLHIFEDYTSMELITDEEIETLKEYQRIKNEKIKKENNEEEEEREF